MRLTNPPKDMNQKNQFCNRLIRRLLTILGFGTSFVFMACYGPAPSHGSYEDDSEVFAVVGDSVDDEVVADSTAVGDVVEPVSAVTP